MRKGVNPAVGSQRSAAGMTYDSGYLLCCLLSLLCVLCPVFVVPCAAVEKTTITSDSLVYDEKTSTYVATGHARIERGLAVLEADEVRYHEKTSEAEAEGSVVYEDQSIRIKAKRAAFNLDSKTGTLYDAEVFSKKDNYHIKGVELEKTGEKEFKSSDASFTTCDAPVPEWCFRGKDIDLVVGDTLKARDIVFDIKGRPVAYFPYLSAPVDNERKTGFLLPSVGLVKDKGLHYTQQFFLVLSENRDATFLLDAYTKRGIGEGIEYRFVETGGAKGDFWVYHLYDTTLKDHFWDLKGVLEKRENDEKFNAFLKLDYINSIKFYTEYNSYLLAGMRAYVDSASYLSETSAKFLETNGEVSQKFGDSRLYLRTQYLFNLDSSIEQSTVPQRLPEVGYSVNPSGIGPVTFSLSSSIANFWREQGARGQRLDVYPRFSYSFGKDITILQSLGLRETAYSLSQSDDFGSSPHRESFDYSVTAHTRLVKQYGAFLHILEPSLGFTYIPDARSNLPLFDSTELYTKTATGELALLNRFADKSGEFLTVRLRQDVDAYQGNRAFQPVKIDALLQRPLLFRTEAQVSVQSGTLEVLNSDIGITIPGNATLALGERYNRADDTMFYSLGLNAVFTKTLSTESSFWFDAKNGGLKDIVAKLKYQAQCWGVTTVLTKNQSNLSVTVHFTLLGLGSIKL